MNILESVARYCNWANTVDMQSQTKVLKTKVTRPSPGAKLKRDKARNALRDTRIGLEIAVLQIGKLLDEFGMVKTDGEVIVP